VHLHWEFVVAAAAALLLVASAGGAVKPTSAEIARAHDWTVARFGDAREAPTADTPFSFVYGGRPSPEFVKTWKLERRSGKLDGGKTERVLTYTDPGSGLVVTCRAVEYGDFPTVEWTLRLKNTGTADTPIISDVRPLDTSFVRRNDSEFQLHWHTADNCSQDSYAPHVEPLGPNAVKQFASTGGRPTSGTYPYYNIEMDDKLGGAVVVRVRARRRQGAARARRTGADALHLASRRRGPRAADRAAVLHW
jgi:hypothetical protein